jgi:transcriptional regulator with XRE-family HTH domain
MPARQPTAFGELLRYWRGTRKLSQLELALAAEVSARHVSFVETGRSRPSREMVLRLVEVLDLPLRDRNKLLHAAGLAPAFGETDLDSAEMAGVRRSLEFLLDRHDPCPAVVVDRHWNLLLQNRGAAVVLPRFVASPAALAPPINVMRLLFDPNGVRPFIVNWDELAASMVQRLHREAALDPGDDRARVLLETALAAGVPASWRVPELGADQSPMVEMRLRDGELELALFSAVTTIGTPLDVTLQELRLETFFPVDEASAAALRSLTD